MEPGDVLADDVHVGRPESVETLLVGPVADRGDVVEQGVEPDVDRLLGVERNLDAPGEPLAGDGDVPELGFDEVDDLVAPAFGLDEIRVRRVVSQQAVAVGREAEEVVLFLDPGQRRAWDGWGSGRPPPRLPSRS